MDGRWFKYKDNIVNLEQIQSFRAERVTMSRGDAVAYGYSDVKPTKQKPWVLYAGHQSLDCFKMKSEAMQVAEDIVKGKYDLKMG